MTNNQETSNSELFVPVMLAALFILFVVVLVWITQIKPITDQGFAALPIVAASEAEVADTAAAPAAPAAPAESAVSADPVDLDAVIAAINTGGCTACHTIPDIPNAIGQVGPNLSNIGVDAATRRDGYTAQEYIYESITEPNAFTAPECPFGPCIPGQMPQIQLNEEQVQTIVSYLVTLGK